MTGVEKVYRSVLIVIVAVSLILMPACSDDQHSKSVEEAETYDDLLMDFEYNEDDDEEDDDAEDDADYRPDEASILEQSYLDAIHHWEVNQPWPKPKKNQIKTDTVK